jgi:hypothetical protein
MIRTHTGHGYTEKYNSKIDENVHIEYPGINFFFSRDTVLCFQMPSVFWLSSQGGSSLQPPLYHKLKKQYDRLSYLSLILSSLCVPRIACVFYRCCYITVDSATTALLNGACTMHI